MEWKQSTHPIERAAVAISALSFGGAVSFAIFALTPPSGNLLTAAAVSGGLMAACIAFMALSRIGEPQRSDMRGFRIGDPVDAMEEQEPREPWFDLDESTEDEEAMEDELLLDDPLPAVDPDSRVIRLFQREQPAPLPEPGELVARIADYIDSGRGRPAGESEPARNDAHAALHVALADIRRSLG